MEPDEQLHVLPLSGHGDPSPAGPLRGLPADSRTPTRQASVTLTKHYEKAHPDLIGAD
jgi:hypothetical protein